MKRIMLVLSLAFVLACGTLAPIPTPIPTVTETHSPTSTPATAEVFPAVTLTLKPKPTGFTKVRILPSDGALVDQLAAEAQKAAALGQMPVVEFDASW